MSSAKADDAATCGKGSGDETITACTRLISSGKLKGNNLAIVLNNRGNAYHGKNDDDRAIADSPTHSVGCCRRCSALRSRGG